MKACKSVLTLIWMCVCVWVCVCRGVFLCSVGFPLITQKLKCGIPNLPQSSDIGQNSDGGISHYQISGRFLINKNFHNYRTSNDIDMKLNQ